MSNENSVEASLDETRAAIRKAVDLYLNNVTGVDASILADHLYECLSDEFDRLYRIEATAADLAERWEQMARPERGAIKRLEGPAADQVANATTERTRIYRRAARDLRLVLLLRRIPHDLMTDAELEKHGTTS